MSERTFLDRAMRLVKPAPLASYAPEPRELAPGLWLLERRLTMPPGLVLPVNTTIVRLRSGGLVVLSPPAPDPATAAAISALGRVEALVAPNSFHYVFAAGQLASFPGAKLFLAPGLAERIPELPPATPLGEAAADLWAGEIDQAIFGPVGAIAEVTFFHRSSATLMMTDLAFNMRTIDGVYQTVGWRLFGVPAAFGPSRTARLAFLRDADAARPYLQRIARWEFQRIVVAHGEPVETNAGSEFRRAFARYL